MRTGGEIVAGALRAHGVDTVFCVPGESYLPVLDALYDHRGAISVIACRHEHGAAHMAEAYGKLTGRPGIAMVTRGPGACNASIGVHTAFQDSTPMLLLVGQVPRRFRGRGAFQEVDLVRMFAPLAKKALEVDAAAGLSPAIAEAFAIARSGRPGPVVVALPEDVLKEETDAADASPHAPEPREPETDALDRLRRALTAAQRPLMIVGGGGWNDEARDDIVAFAEANDLPACCSFRRHDIFANVHPGFIGELGIGPDPALVARIQEADLVLAVGTRLGEIPTQGYTLFEAREPRCMLVHVHPDAAEPGRVFRPAIAIVADVLAFARAARALAPVDGRRWRDWARDARQDYETNRQPPPATTAPDLGRIMADLDRLLPADAVVTVDAGNFAGWPQRFLRFGGGRRLLGAANGAMGYGVPAAVAAKLACPERTVVACVGDGGFGMTGQELATAQLHGATPIILVFNNAMYGTIRMHQERSYPAREIATRLCNPDFSALARAFDAHGATVTRTEEFLPAFEAALGSGKASLIELRLDPEAITTRTTLSEIRRRALSSRGG